MDYNPSNHKSMPNISNKDETFNNYKKTYEYNDQSYTWGEVT